MARQGKKIPVRLVSLLLAVGPALLAAPSPGRPAPVAPAAESRLLLAHYMPWFQAGADGKSWGWHWTMNHYHPERVADGKREAASHYTPVIGLYDSDDGDVLECQVLL